MDLKNSKGSMKLSKDLVCTSCGAEFHVPGPSVKDSYICPFCGIEVKVEVSGDSSEEMARLVPFQITEEDVVAHLRGVLGSFKDVPDCLVDQIKTEKIVRYEVPMYLMNGTVQGAWTATAIYDKTRQVKDRDGKYKTEHYHDYAPMNGNVYSAFWVLSAANQKAVLPKLLRNYISCIPCSEGMLSDSVFVKRGQLARAGVKDEVRLEEDADSAKVYRSQSVQSYLNQEFENVVQSQISGSYKNLRHNGNFQCSTFEKVVMKLYLVTFTFDGLVYTFCIDGLGRTYRIDIPERFKEGYKRDINKSFNKRNFKTMGCGIPLALVLASVFVSVPIAAALILILGVVIIVIKILNNRSKKRKKIEDLASWVDQSGEIKYN